ncbi:low molecular weight protein-tyrosine-phosphatase [Chitinimonas lacunae]|uniref:Low molecular weight protein-tyrosine-phosphatase n=1 Tax=Chitinimonas lacunae TaxID=1963018 RepID=A0ABV8MX74_9NEIS
MAAQPFAILLVCLGNICRSPTAEGVLRTLAERRGITLTIDSCGTDGYHTGEPPDRRSQRHALRRGYDLAALRARQVTPADFSRFDLLLAMDRSNLARLHSCCPAAERHKLKLFLDYSRIVPGGDVPDPYYGGDDGFERVLDLIEDAAAHLLDTLRQSDSQRLVPIPCSNDSSSSAPTAPMSERKSWPV